MTDAERFQWSRLLQRQLLGFKFRRQVPLDYYIADSVCLEKRLIIELDGGHHNLDDNVTQDRKRTLWLEAQDFRVLRFWNHEVLESIDAVLEVIAKALEE